MFKKAGEEIDQLIKKFLESDNQSKDKSTDQLLNAVYLLTREVTISQEDKKQLQDILFKPLTDGN